MHIFEWVLGWFPSPGAIPIFNRVGLHVRTNGGRAPAATSMDRTKTRTTMNKTTTRTRG